MLLDLLGTGVPAEEVHLQLFFLDVILSQATLIVMLLPLGYSQKWLRVGYAPHAAELRHVQGLTSP